MVVSIPLMLTSIVHVDFKWRVGHQQRKRKNFSDLSVKKRNASILFRFYIILYLALLLKRRADDHPIVVLTLTKYNASVGWLVGRSIGWLVDQSVSWLVGRGPLAGRSVRWLVSWGPSVL